MPGLDGHEVVRHIRAHRGTGRHPTRQEPIIIALTASALEDERETILAAGSDDFIKKPFRETAIFEALSRHLGMRFIYASDIDIAAAPPEKEPPVTVLMAQAQRLPTEWRTAMHQAALVGDITRITDLVAQVPGEAPLLAKQLNRYIYNFEYHKILRIIQPENA